MDRVRDLVAAGDVTVVLAQDRDRFAREPAYHYLLRREFEEYGTKIRALNDRGDESPEGELTDGILDQLAKFERAKTAERSRRGKLRKAREGKIVATNKIKHGFAYNAMCSRSPPEPSLVPGEGKEATRGLSGEAGHHVLDAGVVLEAVH
jgi:site-specific DNA recombinase